ncbi:MAG: L,D-transpeptidase [Anaerolineales bacterium]|nr:L,D-transpeptidase [Anaerolineales bacterium]
MMMSKHFSRRDFLKLSGLALTSLAFQPRIGPTFGREDSPLPALIGRVAIQEIDVYSQPRTETSLIVGKRYRDQLVSLYYPLISPDGPEYNPIWYRVWGGYIFSGYLQLVKSHLNPVLDSIPEEGQLGEITVPFAQAYRYSSFDGWYRHYRLYHATTHWITGIEEGPDGKPWYEITNELDRLLKYYVPAPYLRSIADEELSPLSPEVPPEEKHIVISLAHQKLTAYESDREVFSTSIASGRPSTRPTTNNIPTETPRGSFNIVSKYPSKHMGNMQTSGAPAGYVLPGVPWTTFFVFETGIAFHGTFWHNNFGVPMSAGCVNMRNEDAKWLFRWTTPYWEVPVEDPSTWDRRGHGTRVEVI